MRRVLILITGALYYAGAAGCVVAPQQPVYNPCAGLTAEQCENKRVRDNIAKAAAAEALTGASQEQIARDTDAMNRQWCITKAQRLNDHEQMVSAIKECRELWPDSGLPSPRPATTTCTSPGPGYATCTTQ